MTNIVITLPKECEPYAQDMRRFMDAMVHKLCLNAHKGRWDGMTVPDAMDKLMAETAELDEAIKRGNMVEIMLEASDVANFALIISSIAIERGK